MRFWHEGRLVSAPVVVNAGGLLLMDGARS